MRTKTGNWFECKVRFDETQEDGTVKKVTKPYVVDAVSFGDAEKKITKEMSRYVSGKMEIKTINPTPYKEIFFSDADTDDKWYKAKLAFITIDEKTDKEKRSNITYLVQAGSVQKACKNVDEAMSDTMIDYSSLAISETKIEDVFE